MGNIARVECSCGFEKDHVLVGCGMAGISYAPVSCAACGELQRITVGNALGVEDDDGPIAIRTVSDGCPECGGAVVEITDDGGPCPRCAGPLRVARMGLWD